MRRRREGPGVETVHRDGTGGRNDLREWVGEAQLVAPPRCEAPPLPAAPVERGRARRGTRASRHGATAGAAATAAATAEAAATTVAAAAAVAAVTAAAAEDPHSTGRADAVTPPACGGRCQRAGEPAWAATPGGRGGGQCSSHVRGSGRRVPPERGCGKGVGGQWGGVGELACARLGTRCGGDRASGGGGWLGCAAAVPAGWCRSDGCQGL